MANKFESVMEVIGKDFEKGRILVLCCDQNMRDVALQAKASLALLGRVKTVMIGARIVLESGDVSEPVTYIACEPEAVEDIGVAYAAAFEVPGLAQFAGPNAQPALPAGGTY